MVNDSIRNYQLVLQPAKVCLSVCKYNGHCPSWNSRDAAKKHLKALMGDQLSVLYLKDVEILNSEKQTQRVLLTFSTSEMPSVLLQNKRFLKL